MELQRPDGGHHHRRVGHKARRPALDIQKFFRTQIRAEAGLGDAVLPQVQGRPGGSHAVAAVGDVGKGAAVDDGGRALQRLHQIGQHGLLQKCRHGALGFQVMGGNGLSGSAVTHDHAAQSLLQIRQILRHAENGHGLRGHSDVKMLGAGNAVDAAPYTSQQSPELPVIYIHAAPPDHPVYPQFIALINMVIHHGSQEIIGRADGVEIPGEMKVDVLHGDDLGISAPGGAPLQAEHRPEGRLPQGQHRLLPHPVQGIRQADAGGGLALSGLGGVDGGD